jgi:hypothetical protein
MSNAASTAAAELLAGYIRSLSTFEWRSRNGPVYHHMGAIITDAILQAGLNYRTVVAPRVRQLLSNWPDVCSTTGFLTLLNAHGAGALLRWHHPEKANRITELATFLHCREIETYEGLAAWICIEVNAETLLSLHGIGPKTRDYLAMLVGVPSIAVDRHLTAFVRGAGVPCATYEETRTIVRLTADVLGVDQGTLDYSIWAHTANA